MKILGLDLSTTATGWCALYTDESHIDVGTKGFPTPKKGRRTIPDEHPGKQFGHFTVWIYDILYRKQIDIIAYEEPAGHFKSMNALLGLRGIMYAAACAFAVPVYTIYPSQLKKWATGKGNADKSTMRKALEERLFWVSDDNQVDAIWLAYWCESMLDEAGETPDKQPGEPESD